MQEIRRRGGGGEKRRREKEVKRTIETLLIRNIVNQQDAHSTAVVCRSNSPEALLAGCIPDLQLDTLAIELDGPYLEVDADGGDEGGGERVFTEAQETA